MILHIPHSSTRMLPNIHVTDLTENQKYYTDWYTDDLFFHESAEKIIFPFSRFSIDVERLENDPMNEYGLGIFYTKDIFGDKIIRDMNLDDLQLYEDHHHLLTERTNFYTGYFKKVTIIDCHSFNDFPLYFERDSSWLDRPDFCIGINKESEASNKLVQYFKDNEFRVKINRPYSGSIIPKGFENSDDIESIMIEVNKKLYLNNDLSKNDKYNYIKNIITGGLNIVYEHNG